MTIIIRTLNQTVLTMNNRIQEVIFIVVTTPESQMLTNYLNRIFNKLTDNQP